MGHGHSTFELPPESDGEAVEYALSRHRSNKANERDRLEQDARPVDLRSDTVTKPTVQMRVAMAFAEVDDDVLGDDPTVLLLEEKTAQLFEKEASVFVPSGTMANLIAIMVHCDVRGSELIVGDKSHIHIYEQGGCSQIAGVHPRVLRNLPDGTLDLDEVQAAIRLDDMHFPVTRLLCLENTHNKCGGRVLTQDYIDRAGSLAAKNGIRLHMDGARLMNAAVALNTAPARITQHVDSVSLCLSKALGAPVGSMLIGTSEFIAKARRMRKVLGGGMRQVGIIAAAGLCALDAGPRCLQMDHKHARQIAHTISLFSSFSVDEDTVESNIIMVDTGAREAIKVQHELEEHGVKILAIGPHTLRIVLHYQV
mmetsp:Transcript_20589/g.57127  ORF Transcript_20589/g.57127 Transcript_20589/m.57127 type:complete len:367 (-) Transcript_20589:1066-2166(-)|eukprot:CAMPEP_0117652470 /NCGR_PEP_ID=MMETSP0804-20121206/2645_1 /TAXON_ID=1074897 /ORGANISM="Tetraselmis astigmatica, Strain CCMP880" /LENGTH=366 /DNA_ID=CAMNT_0005458521 /DNA_START=52 /DNA_END=1152 /DNA_ORIENTATION=+